MRLMLSGPMGGQGFPADALQMMEEGARLAEELGDSRSLANLWGTVSMYHSMQGDTLRACEFAGKAFQAAERSEDVELVATNGFELCLACALRGEYGRVAEVAPRILDFLEKAQMQMRWDLGKYYNVNLYSAVLSYYGISLGLLSDFDKGQAFCEKACSFAQEVDNITSLAVVETTYNLFLLMKGDGKRALEHVEKFVRYSEQAGLATMLWIAPTLLGHACYLQGDLDAAHKHFEERLEIYRSTEYPLLLAWNYYGLGMVHLDCSDLKSARSNIEESLKLSRGRGERWVEGLSTIALGMVVGKAEPSQSAQAEEYMLRGVRILDELKFRPYVAVGHLFLGDLYADTGQKERALESLKKALSMFKEMGTDYWLRRTQNVLEKLEG